MSGGVAAHSNWYVARGDARHAVGASAAAQDAAQGLSEEEQQDNVPPIVAAVLRGHIKIMEFLVASASYSTPEESQEAFSTA